MFEERLGGWGNHPVAAPSPFPPLTQCSPPRCSLSLSLSFSLSSYSSQTWCLLPPSASYGTHTTTSSRSRTTAPSHPRSRSSTPLSRPLPQVPSTHSLPASRRQSSGHTPSPHLRSVRRTSRLFPDSRWFTGEGTMCGCPFRTTDSLTTSLTTSGSRWRFCRGSSSITTASPSTSSSFTLVTITGIAPRMSSRSSDPLILPLSQNSRKILSHFRIRCSLSFSSSLSLSFLSLSLPLSPLSLSLSLPRPIPLIGRIR